jgi:hypothetical protein
MIVLYYTEYWTRKLSQEVTYFGDLTTNFQKPEENYIKKPLQFVLFTKRCSLRQRGWAGEWNYPLTLGKVNYKNVSVFKHTDRTESSHNYNYNLNEVSVQQLH